MASLCVILIQVNALAVLSPHQTVLSASSDRKIAVWKLGSQKNEPYPEFLLAHSDYVNGLAVLDANSGIVASAGLRGEIMIWDLMAERCLGDNEKDGAVKDEKTHPKTFDGLVSPSIYSIAPVKTTNAAEGDGSALLAVGSVDNVVRVWDCRKARPLNEKSPVALDSPRASLANAACVHELRGHTEPVRSIVSGCGDIPMIASAGADCSIRYWDLRNTRTPVYALFPHHQSIWAMTSYDENDLSVVLSADKGGHIRATNLSTRQTKLVASVPESVLCLHLSRKQKDFLFVGSTSSSILGFKLDKSLVSDFSGCEGTESIVGRSRRIGRAIDATVEAADPVLSKAEICLDGYPSVVEHSVCPDKRKIIARYSDETVVTWDVLKMDKVRKAKPSEKEDGTKLFQRHVRAIQEKQWYLDIPTWFTSDIKLGCLGITLNVRNCFKAERYANDLDLTLSERPVQNESRINFGELLLRSVFAGKIEQDSNGHASPQAAKGRTSTVEMDPVCLISAPPDSSSSLLTWRIWNDGDADWNSLIPMWIQDFVLEHRSPIPPEPKWSFLVHPAEGSGLPSVPQPKLNAPRIIRIHQIVNFVENKLPVVKQSDDDPVPQVEKPQLQISCLGVLLGPRISLATIKKHVWKRPDDVVLHYSAQDTSAQGTTLAQGTLAEGTSAEGTSAEGTSAEGTSAEGTSAEGTSAEGTSAEGTSAEGTSAEGTSTEGTSTEGTST